MNDVVKDAVEDTIDKKEKEEAKEIQEKVTRAVSLLSDIDDLNVEFTSIARKVQAEHGITVKNFKKIAKTAHKASIEEVRLEFDEFNELYKKIIK